MQDHAIQGPEDQDLITRNPIVVVPRLSPALKTRRIKLRVWFPPVPGPRYFGHLGVTRRPTAAFAQNLDKTLPWNALCIFWYRNDKTLLNDGAGGGDKPPCDTLDPNQPVLETSAVYARSRPR